MGHLKNSQHIKLSEHRLEEILNLIFFSYRKMIFDKKITVEKKNELNKIF